MLHSTPAWLQIRQAKSQRQPWPRRMSWVGLLTLTLLLAWHGATPGALLAAGTVAASEQWHFVDESKPGAPVVRGELVVAAEQAPTAVAARFAISSTMQALALQLNDAELAGLPLFDVDELGYCTRLDDGLRPYAVTLQINIDADVSDGDDSWQGRLVYTPSYNGAVIQGEWQCWNTLVGKWWATGGPVAQYAGVDNPQPLGTLLARFPKLGINRTYSTVALKAGDGWDHFVGEASPVAIGVEGERINIAFGDAPQGNQVLLPVLLNESPPSNPSGQEPQGSDDGNRDKNNDKNRDNKDKDKKVDPDKAKDEKKQDRQVDWGNLDWANVDWGAFDWESLDWAKVDWENIDWSAFGWPEARSGAMQAFIEDVKQCKDNGWREMGFITPGLCVAYFAKAHALSDAEWSHRDWGRGWDNDDWRDDD